MHSMNVKLIVIDSIASLFLKVKDRSRYFVRKYITEISRLVLVVLQSNDQTQAQRQHQMLKLTRDLK